MAYSDSFPATRPVFQADFANGGRVDPRISYSRSTTGTYFGTEKVLSSENILLQSQTLDTTWAALHVAAPTGSQTAPDGSSTAWLLTADSASSRAPYVIQSPTLSGSTQYTMVGHLKAGTASHGYISFRTQNGDSAYALLDFSGGTVSHAGFGDFTGVSSSVTALGSSWFKVTLTATTGTNLSGNNVFVGISDGTTPTSAGYATWNSAGETMYAWGVQLATTNAKVYDSPTTTQIAREYQTKLQTAAINAPRFEFSATDSASMGLLVEGSVANVMPYSRNGFNASNAFQYTLQSGVTATESAAVGPSGSLDATLIAEDSSTGGHQFQTTETVTSAAHTVSVYVKPVGVPSFGIRITSGSVYGSVFTFADESFTNYGTAPETSRIEPVGNGWYRLSISQTVTSGSSLIRFNLFDAGGSASYVGNGFNGILVWGFQCEANAFPSSWIDTGTSGSTATRAADSAAMVNSSLFDNGGGTLYAEASRQAQNTYNGIFSVDDGSGSNIVQMFGYNSNFRAEISSGGTTVANMTAAGNSVNTFHKHAVSFSPSEAKYYVNGSQIGSTDTDLNIPTMSQIHLGELNTSGNHLNGHIRKVAVYSEPVSATNAAALTK